MNPCISHLRFRAASPLLALLALLTLLLGACAAPATRDLSAFKAAAPRSILVVPTVNKSLDVDAPGIMLSTLTVPLAEKGFYVFPVRTTQTVLEQEGLYESEQVHQLGTPELAGLFGADAVLYVTIERWDARYAVVSTTVTVEFDYRMVAKDGTEIWHTRQAMSYSPQQQGGGSALATLMAAAISAAVARATPNYLPLARQANDLAMVKGPSALPDGPYAKPRH